METMSIDYFPALDDQYRDFSGGLYPMAGVCGSDRRCDTVAPSGESRGARRENTAGIAIKIPQARILPVRADYGTIGEVTAYFLINGRSVAEIAGQNKSDYDKKKFHTVLLGKITKISRFESFSCRIFASGTLSRNIHSVLVANKDKILSKGENKPFDIIHN